MFWRRKAATHSHCMNCGSELHGPFCATCGQRDDDLRRPFWTFLWQFADDLFDLDSRVAHTIVPLLFVPGLMTRAYNAGRRAHYVPPLRLYLIASLAFFVIVGVSNIAIVKFEVTLAEEDWAQEGNVAQFNRNKALAISAIQEQLDRIPTAEGELEPAQEELRQRLEQALEKAEGTSPSPQSSIRLKMFMPLTEAEPFQLPQTDFIQIRGDGEVEAFVRQAVAGFEKAVSNPRRLNGLINKWLPRAMVLLLPVFALILRLFYWGKQQYFLNQLIFSLHFHTFIFVLLTLIIIAELLLPGIVSGDLFLLIVGVYLLIALKIASDQGWFRTTVKFVIVSFLYFIVLSVTLTAVFVWGLHEL